MTKTTQLALFVFFVALSVLGSLWIWDSRSQADPTQIGGLS